MEEAKQQKVKQYYQMLFKFQSERRGKEIGLIIIKDEKLADFIALTDNSNATTTYELTKETVGEEIVKALARDLAGERLVFLRLHEWLDPKIYNQLHLMSKNGRMQYPELDDWKILDVSRKANIIIVTTDQELEALNYDNILNLVGPTLRL